MNLVKKLAMVILMEHDLEAAVEFYKKLGLKQIFHLKNRWAEFNLDGVQVGLCPTDHKFEEFRTGVVFQIDNLTQFYADNKDTIPFLDIPFEAVHGIMASIKDPGGNVIDLYQPTPEKIKEFADKVRQEEGCCQKEATSCCKEEGAKNDTSSPSSCC